MDRERERGTEARGQAARRPSEEENERSRTEPQPCSLGQRQPRGSPGRTASPQQSRRTGRRHRHRPRAAASAEKAARSPRGRPAGRATRRTGKPAQQIAERPAGSGITAGQRIDSRSERRAEAAPNPSRATLRAGLRPSPWTNRPACRNASTRQRQAQAESRAGQRQTWQEATRRTGRPAQQIAERPASRKPTGQWFYNQRDILTKRASRGPAPRNAVIPASRHATHYGKTDRIFPDCFCQCH